jgi:hypothetical protein
MQSLLSNELRSAAVAASISQWRGPSILGRSLIDLLGTVQRVTTRCDWPKTPAESQWRSQPAIVSTRRKNLTAGGPKIGLTAALRPVARFGVAPEVLRLDLAALLWPQPQQRRPIVSGADSLGSLPPSRAKRRTASAAIAGRLRSLIQAARDFRD